EQVWLWLHSPSLEPRGGAGIETAAGLTRSPGLFRKFSDGSAEFKDLLLAGAQAADRNRMVLHVAPADRQDQRHVGQRMLADLVVDLLVAQVHLDPHAGRPELVGDFARIGVGIVDDRGYHR